jgi:ABC-type Fe3+/spermidine/putrescine transport system ATPase subunit
MKDGEIVESGSPRDLYERPASRFTAEFIGNANILEGTVIRAAGESSALVSLFDGLTIEGHFSRPEGARPPQPILVCIRAESILRVRDADDGANTFDAEVTSVNFLGPVVTCFLRIGRLSLRAELPARNAPTTGETIRIRVEPDAAILISTASRSGRTTLPEGQTHAH